MEQVEEIPFSGVVAKLLLEKPDVSCLEIVNFISKISQGEGDVIYDVIEDDCDCLSICVDSLSNGGFRIKNGVCYGTVLYDGITVRDYLMNIASSVKDNRDDIINNRKLDDDIDINKKQKNYNDNGLIYNKDYSRDYRENRNRFEFMPKRRVKSPWMMRRA